MAENALNYFLAASKVKSPGNIVDGSVECPSCGGLEFSEPGGYEICGACGWEDDPVQEAYPDLEGGANKVSLNQARKNFESFGWHVEKPKPRVLP